MSISSCAYATVEVAYQAGPSGRWPCGVNGLGRRGSSSIPDRSTSHDPGTLLSNRGAVTYSGPDRPTISRFAAARNAVFTSIPTAYGFAHSASVSNCGSRTQSYASSSRTSVSVRWWVRGNSAATTGCSSGASGGAGSTATVREPGTDPDTQVPVASSFTARVGGRNAVISSRPATAVEPRGVNTRAAYAVRTRASSAGGNASAFPHARVSSAPHGSTASCTHCRSPLWAGR